MAKRDHKKAGHPTGDGLLGFFSMAASLVLQELSDLTILTNL